MGPGSRTFAISSFRSSASTIQYHYLYSTDTLKDRNGNEVGSLARTGPLGTTTVTVDPDIDVFALVPTFAWVSSWQVLGARYGAYIAPSFADNSAQVNLSLARSGRFRDTGSSTTLDSDTGFGIGDLFVQPLWLGWSGKHYDVAAGYGFYAPTGEEGIGLEFWTNQFQLAGAWYPFENRGTAVTLAGTYEIQSEMDDQDLTPGDRVSLNWGVSQYLPLTKDQTWLAELGASGYSQWQVEEDSGSDVPQIRNVQLNAKDEVHAAGIQAGLTFVPWKAALTVRYQWGVWRRGALRRGKPRGDPSEGILIPVGATGLQLMISLGGKHLEGLKQIAPKRPGRAAGRSGTQ
ncbi:MAG: SphA family protein [Gammaproteobacteria bacterium]